MIIIQRPPRSHFAMTRLFANVKYSAFEKKYCCRLILGLS